MGWHKHVRNSAECLAHKRAHSVISKIIRDEVQKGEMMYLLRVNQVSKWQSWAEAQVYLINSRVCPDHCPRGPRLTLRRHNLPLGPT